MATPKTYCNQKKNAEHYFVTTFHSFNVFRQAHFYCLCSGFFAFVIKMQILISHSIANGGCGDKCLRNTLFQYQRKTKAPLAFFRYCLSRGGGTPPYHPRREIIKSLCLLCHQFLCSALLKLFIVVAVSSLQRSDYIADSLPIA